MEDQAQGACWPFFPGPASAPDSLNRLSLFDLKGSCQALPLEEGQYASPRVSADGKRVALSAPTERTSASGSTTLPAVAPRVASRSRASIVHPCGLVAGRENIRPLTMMSIQALESVLPDPNARQIEERSASSVRDRTPSFE
jgi:hypothetical protein